MFFQFKYFDIRSFVFYFDLNLCETYVYPVSQQILFFLKYLQTYGTITWKYVLAIVITAKKATILYIWKPSNEFESTTHCSLGNCFRIISFFFSPSSFISFVHPF